MQKRIWPLYFLLFLFLGVFSFAMYMTFQPVPQPENLPVATQQPVLAAPEPETPEEERVIDFASLQTMNPDCVAWLEIPCTDIDYPIVLGGNNSYYLKHSFQKEYSNFGCPFLNTNTPLSGDNLVIHGHNMGNNRTEMFSPLLWYQDGDYAKEHDTFLLYLPGEKGNEKRVYRLQYIINYKTTQETYPYVQSVFEEEGTREEFLQYFKDRSIYTPETEPGQGQTLILSTCNTRYGSDNRFLLLAVMEESSSGASL